MDRIKKRAAIKAISSYLPAGELTNEQLAEELGDVEASVILERTGIRTRRIAGAEECASDLGVAAARHLFESGAAKPEEIDFLLFCTQSPDYLLPTTACVMQERMGLGTSCGAIDFNQGCSGYVYGLSLAKSLVETDVARNVLLVTADTYSKYINARDKSVRTLFGDGASATLISAADAEADLIGPFVFGTDGRGAERLIVPAGGTRRPLDDAAMIESEDEQGNWRSARNLYMNGPEIFNFTMRTVPQVMEELLMKWGHTLDEIDYVIPHQANKFMLERLQRRLKIPDEKFHIELEKTGNTVSSTIPIALESARRQGRIKAGDTVALIGFGVGYSWAATLVRVV
ncbi:MAG TPA: ketoacyl-ACP synthase III [Pyrinomonadaceae bacterium]|nr:ketoacyl-ACP synthase III [Pyrinomonadaceae bacterium]